MNDEFDTLVHEAFYSFMEFRPDFATHFGLHYYDKKMPSGARESYLAFIEVLSEYLQKFLSVPKEDLSPERQIDRDIMVYTLKLTLFREREIRQWEKYPNPADVIGFAIHTLFSREFASFEKRLESITARLLQCPQFIEEFKSRVRTPPTLWKDLATETCNSLPRLFQTISTAAHQEGLDTSELDEAAAQTGDALTKYTEWLTSVPGEEAFNLGKDMFEKLLSVRGLGLASDEILKIGKDYLKKGKERLRELAPIIDPSSTVEEVRTRIRNDHPPTFQDALEEYRKTIDRMRKIVIEKGFASLPEGEHLTVQETPPFLRHVIPTAAYMNPAKFEKDQKGIYFVTSVEGDLLREHNYANIVNTSVHEGYPGHHVQLSWANKNPSLVRALCFAPEFVEGWAHYCEERMRDYGLNDTVLQFEQALDIIFKAVKIILDVKLHCGEMTFDEAVSLLQSETGMEQYAAVAQVKYHTLHPGYPLSYLLGKHFLLQLQKEVQNHLKEKYSEKQFHNIILQAGSIPFPYLREELKMKGML